ncbi:TetR/AcrR family transcriptional regulator [Fodinicola acaciae]|uniref:TetR/AcrR family transcriptional regulator n=1 Tax=Fodinicola acaciae TaxID=2681555 RepID=UPI0013D61141|nr:TetR/AcrR family transcriptional regulator [Fodinicola acaciae]
MNASQTARERARTELTREIKEEARRQLAAEGAERLSLRGVARELGLVSSALYRYFPSKDELLTALIIDAYNAIGDAAETGAAGSADLVGRWRGACHGVRAWARAHPREYLLIYGATIPGYVAPQDTVGPAARVALVLLGIVREAAAAGELTPVTAPPLSPGLSRQIQALAASVGPELPHGVLARAVLVWTQLFGLISFELTGQYVGSVDPADEFFEYAIGELAGFLGLPG